MIVMEALSKEFGVGYSRELLYAGDLVLVAETLEDLKKKLKIWKNNIEAKGLRSMSIKQSLYAANTICQ